MHANKIIKELMHLLSLQKWRRQYRGSCESCALITMTFIQVSNLILVAGLPSKSSIYIYIYQMIETGMGMVIIFFIADEGIYEDADLRKRT